MTRKKTRAKSPLRAAAKPSDIVFAASDINIEASAETGAPEVNVTAYTGDMLSLANFPNPAVINLAGVRAMSNEQIPFLRDHQQTKVVGHGKPSVGASQLQHSGKLSIAGEERDKIVAGHKEGFNWQASVGGRIPDVRKNVQTIAAGESVRVNGRVFEGPLHVVNAFLWKETSFVAVGADEGRASASVAAAQSQGVTPMNEFEKWLEASGFNSEEMSDSQVTAMQKVFDDLKAAKAPEPVKTPAGVDMDKVVASATQAAMQAAQMQTQRDRRIDRLFAGYGDTTLDKDAIAKLRSDVEAGNITEEKAHLELLLASRGKGGTSNVAIHSGGSRENYALELEAGVGRTNGLTEEQIHECLVEAGASQDRAEAAVERSRKNPKGLKSVILAICRQEGHHADEVDDDAIRCAMNASARDANIQASSGWSTVVLPGILGRLANKAMLAAYAEADNGGVALQICSTTSTRDFKKFSRYRMTESGVFEIVAGGTGEIKHGHLTEETYENKVETYGKMLSLTRQMMRNDDLDAFMQIPRMIGRMARHALEQSVITTLVNAPTAAGAGTTEFFHSAARGNQEPNYLVGADSGLSLEALGPAYELFLNQVDADGKPIMIDPSLLLCTNADIITARKLYSDTQYRFTTSDTSELINNQWAGMFSPVKSSYLHRLGATPSATQWYLLSNPTTDVSGIQIAFLDGQQTPTINSAETSFNTLGMQMRGYFDFGVALQDPRAIVKVKGAA